MSLTVISYKVKDGRAAENRSLVERVFQDLERAAPADLRYLVLDLGEGNFLHIVAAGEGSDTKPLTETAAFKAFNANHGERRSGPLNRSPATVIGNYQMLSDIG